MPELRPSEGEIWSDGAHTMHRVLDVNAHWVCCVPTNGFEDLLIPLDTFIRDFRYIGTPAQPFQPPIIVDGGYWYLKPGNQNFGAQGALYTIYDYRDGMVSIVDDDDYDRFRFTIPEEQFRAQFHVGAPLPETDDLDDANLDDISGPYRGVDDGGPYRTDPDEVEPDMEVLRVILANIPPGMALARVFDALAPAYQAAVNDMREDGTLVQFSQNGTLLVPWDRVQPPEEPVESPSLWDRLEKDDAGT